ncbi:MAG: DUF6348 family protein [Planctomycetota bacterium]
MKRIASVALILVTLCFCSCDKDNAEDNDRPAQARPEVLREHERMPAKPKSAYSDASSDFLKAWLEEKGEEVIVEPTGVGISGQEIRLMSMLDDYTKPRNAGEDFTIETQFFIKLENGREISNHFNGNGRTFDDAVDDALNNFASTVLKPFYKGFMNPLYRDQEVIELNVNGVERKMYPGELLIRGEQDSIDLGSFSLAQGIKQMLADYELPASETHWILVYYSAEDGNVLLRSVTVDNLINRELSEKVDDLEWPPVQGRMICKQFFVIE